MRTGIVFEINGGKATILRPNGEFITVPASKNWQTGDVVRFSQSAYTVKRLSATAACIVLMVMAGLWGGSLYLTPVALVSMDVNPAIELGLNRFDKVVSMEALNEEGEAILVQKNFVYQDYTRVVAALLQEDGGFASYLRDNPAVVFTVYSDDADKETRLTDELQKAAGNLSTQDGAHIAVECHSVDSHTLESAHAYGVTAGKYLYLQQLIAEDPSLNMTDYTHHSIKQIKEQIDACHSSHSEDTNETHGGSHHRN